MDWKASRSSHSLPAKLVLLSRKSSDGLPRQVMKRLSAIKKASESMLSRRSRCTQQVVIHLFTIPHLFS